MIEDSSILRKVPFSRNRMLAMLGAGIVGAATGVWFPRAADGAQLLAAPFPCFGYPSCSGCNFSGGCSGCSACSNCGCPSGGQCWTACAGGSGTELYTCCDNIQNGSRCICSTRVGVCG
jgi:hypothetical protein